MSVAVVSVVVFTVGCLYSWIVTIEDQENWSWVSPIPLFAVIWTTVALPLRLFGVWQDRPVGNSRRFALPVFHSLAEGCLGVAIATGLVWLFVPDLKGREVPLAAAIGTMFLGIPLFFLSGVFAILAFTTGRETWSRYWGFARGQG